jgi:sulfoxide reductase heme-binding subunit YedZ
MVEVVGVSGGTLTWYVSRATGVVSLVFLTVSVLLGILTSFRWSSPNWPRFVVEFVHRNVSLLIVAFVAVHVVVVVADSFAPIGVLDAVIPFISAYRPLWLGFGALAFDLVVALVVTSLLRHRLGYQTWRLVHWLAYLCWPVAVLHGLGTGTDTTSGIVLVLTAACVVAVLVATALRIGAGLATRPGARAAGLGLLALAPVALVVWVVAGPLASGWARRAGTPETVLAASSNSASAVAGAAAPTTAPVANVPTTAATPRFGSGGFSAKTTGTVTRTGPDASGLVTLHLLGDLTGGAAGSLDVELRGTTGSGGGVTVSSGTVTVSDRHATYRGDIVQLAGGQQIVAQMPGPDSTDWQVVVTLTQLDLQSGTMSAQVQATPVTNRGGASRGGDDR